MEQSTAPYLRGHPEIFTTARFGRNDSEENHDSNKRVKISNEGKSSAGKVNFDDVLILRDSLSPDKQVRSQATTQDAIVSQIGTNSR